MKNIYLLLFYFFTSIAPIFSQTFTNTYILVPGAGHGAWCWKKVIPLLEAKGYKVVALDLPGCGNDTAKLAANTLNDDVNTIIQAANAVNGKVILLGHSSGGVIISQAAEVLGTKKVGKLVYLDAFLPKNGESVLSVAERTIEYNNKFSISKTDTSTQNVELFTEDKNSFRWNPDLVQQTLYHDCSQEDIAYAKAHLSWQSVATIATPVHVTDSIYGRIKKYYIVCTQARDVDKRSMVNEVHCEKVYQLASSHSPFFSMPDKLVAILEATH